MSELTVTVDNKELTFSVTNDDFNQYLNEQMPNDKVAPAFNFLSRTVVESSRDNFNAVLVVDGKPKGIAVLQVAGVLAGEFGGGVQISLKKPSALPAA